MFGVNEIILYPDQDHGQERDLEFCAEILRYLETPQYLRKRMFKLSPLLKFTGILPPLQAPHHNVPPVMARVKVGDLREGLILSRRGDSLLADVGLEKPVTVPGNGRVGERITVRLVSVDQNLRGEIVEWPKMSASGADLQPTYWGYRVHKAGSLRKVLEEKWDLKVGTSRYGTPIQEILTKLTEAIKASQSTLTVFGAPKMGLREILASEKLDPKDALHYFVNTVPEQQTMTVRTEEAVLITLGILNLSVKLAR
jgi:predicted SPOUT superfamily RNA methylase MTH1